jgi:DNA modification methylase
VAERRRTETSSFGVGRRESHDSTAFYNRFRPPVLSDDDNVALPTDIAEPFVLGDSRHMDAVDDGSVGLVVTSPPYFAGKEYEEELEREGVPGSYLEYLELLRDVFAECVRKLEPGGRIAVNVANLGRKPYRSLSADVIRILQDDLGLLLRGELIWQKGEGANGSCAWGSFRSAANPVLRDVTERVVVASKGRFDRAKPIKERVSMGLPATSTIPTDDFLALTLDVWSIPPDSARRIGHPAPFPVELPAQLIRLYTFENDLVLDPFMGSGTTLVAASSLGRRYVGYELDAGYVEVARRRVGEVRTDGGELRAEATKEGKSADQVCEDALSDAGFGVVAREKRVRGTGVTASFVATDALGREWLFDVAGPFTSYRGGLLRAETAWRSLGRAAALRGGGHAAGPVVVLTTDLPPRPGEADTAFRSAGPDVVFDVIGVFDFDSRERLARYAKGAHHEQPSAGFWTPRDLAKRGRRDGNR